METYDFNTIRRKRLVCRKLGRVLAEFTPFLCLLFLCGMTWGYIIKGGPNYDPNDAHTLVYEILGFFLSALWLLYMMITSYAMGFCHLHRIMIIYAYLVALLIYIDRWFGLRMTQKPIQWAFAVGGTVLVVTVIRKLIIHRLICTNGSKHHSTVY